MLVRHAHAESDAMHWSDRTAPLSRRGEREIVELARDDLNLPGGPELIVSSPALRATDTARAVLDRFGLPAQRLRVDERLYAGSASGVQRLISELDEGLSEVMLVGHNPDITDLGRALFDASIYVPTGATLVLRFDAASWGEVVKSHAGSGQLRGPGVSAALATPVAQPAH